MQTLSPRWEQRIKDTLQGDLLQGWQLGLPPQEIQALIQAVSASAEQMALGGLTPVLLVHPDVRLIVRRILESALPQVFVISYNEIAPGAQLKSLGMVE